MAILQFQDLYESAQTFMQEWAQLSVRDEALKLAAPFDGTVWDSDWDNWLLPEITPPNTQIPVGAITPLIMVQGLVQSPSSYTLTAGDGVRGKVVFNSAPTQGPNAIVTATYRRTMLSQSFWQRTLSLATAKVAGSLLTTLDVDNLDEQTSPWFIVVEYAGLIALKNLQSMLAGLGRGSLGNVTMEFHQAGRMIETSIQDLSQTIDKDIVSRRWLTQPLAKVAVPRLPGPFSVLV